MDYFHEARPENLLTHAAGMLACNSHSTCILATAAHPHRRAVALRLRRRAVGPLRRPFHRCVSATAPRCLLPLTASRLCVASAGLPPVMNFGSKFLQDKCVKDCLQGKKFICLAITEPYAGSDVAGLRTTAVKTPCGKFYIVNGEKKWITNGVFCDYFTVAVRTGGEGGAGLSLLLLERGMPGLATKQMKVRPPSEAARVRAAHACSQRCSAWASGRPAPPTSRWRTSRCLWRTSSAPRTTASSTSCACGAPSCGWTPGLTRSSPLHPP